MEFCKLVFCYNDDTEFVNETEKPPSTHECRSCSCESIEELPKSDECCDCIRESKRGTSQRFIESDSCIRETESEYTRRIDKNTITDEYHGFNCVCGNERTPVDKVTITDESEGIHCSCNSNVAVRDSRGQCPNQVSNEPNTLYLQYANFSDKPDVCTNRVEPCVCFDESQTPIKECRISKNQEVSSVNNHEASVVCTDLKYTPGVVESFTSCRCLSSPEANSSVNFPAKYTSTSKERHVCFCTKSIDSKSGLDAGSESLSKGMDKLSKSIEDYSHESESFKETTRYVIRQSIGTSTRSIVETASRLAQISKDVFETGKLNSETKQEKLPATKESPVKSLSTHPDKKKAAKSSQTKKTSSKKYLTNSTDDLARGPSRLLKKTTGQSPKKLLAESEAKKRATKMPITEREAEIPREKQKVTKMICQCCQAICKSPSAPCVSVSNMMPQESGSVKFESTSVQTVKCEKINGAVQNKSKFVSESPLETNDCELRAVQEEESIEDEEDKEVNDEEKAEENMDENKKDKKNDDFCDLEEVIARYNKIHSKRKEKPIEKQSICREITVTKEDIDIIEDYFKDREDEEEETPKSSKKSKNGSFKYHYLMKDTPCATVEVKDLKLLGGKGELEYNFLMMDGAACRAPPPKRTSIIEKSVSSRDSEKGIEKQRRISYRSQTQLQPILEQITQGIRQLGSDEVRQKDTYKLDQDKTGHRDTYYSDLSGSISMNDQIRLSGIKRTSEHLEELARMDSPEEEKEVNLTDATWMGPNQGLTANLETYGSLEKMVADRIIPQGPHHLTNNKEPVSVFEEILKEEKRKFVTSSMASQRSTQSKFRDRGPSKFFDFFRGWMSNKTDAKKKHGSEKRRKSITIRESDEEIASQTPSDSSLLNYEQGQEDDRQRSSLSAYRTRPYPNLAPRQPEGVYSNKS